MARLIDIVSLTYWKSNQQKLKKDIEHGKNTNDLIQIIEEIKKEI